MPEGRRSWMAAAAGAAALVTLLVVTGRDDESPAEDNGLTVASLLGGEAGQGFARASPSTPISFPADHGAHPDYLSEWWYFTGNLAGPADRHFGFQVTFFRFALAAEDSPSSSPWQTRQAWMAHVALTDTETGRFFNDERLARGALDLAGARPSPFAVWLGDWRAASMEESFLPMDMNISTGDFDLRLKLDSDRAPVFQGDNGYSRKGRDPGNASLYYSMTRLEASGEVTVDGTAVPVTGTAWLDREWSTSALDDDVEGWDWFALQFDDDTELMYYRLRQRDGGTAPWSGGKLFGAEGELATLAATDVELETLDEWTSPETGITYPVAWRLAIPSSDMELTVLPRLKAQEMDLSVRYWEGAMEVTGTRRGEPIAGRGYLELAGYGGE